MFNFLLFDGAKLYNIRRTSKKKHFARLAKQESSHLIILVKPPSLSRREREDTLTQSNSLLSNKHYLSICVQK